MMPFSNMVLTVPGRGLIKRLQVKIKPGLFDGFFECDPCYVGESPNVP
jgi:hypothetical protein